MKDSLSSSKQDKLWHKFETHMLNEQVTTRRRAKLLQMYRALNRGLKKDLEKVTRKDMETFIERLHRNNFKRHDGKPYSGSSKSDIKKFCKQFYKWLLGNNEFYPPQVNWIKTKIGKDERPIEKPVITPKQARELSACFRKADYGILTLLLFDSGFRIGELRSCMKKDFSWEAYDENQKCFWLSCRDSKTINRKVPVPLFTEDLKLWANSASFLSKKDNDPLIDLSYETYSKMLRVYGKRVLKLHLTPHAMRHSSATYYARELDGNMGLIADRYGWSYSSRELKTYIRRSGAYQREGAKKVYTNQVLKVKSENAELKDKMEEMEKQLKKIQNFFVDKHYVAAKKK